MKNRERVLNAIRHMESDYAPYSVTFTQQERARVAAHLNDNEFEKKINNHMFQVYYSGWPKEIQPGSDLFKDDFGVVWNRNGADKDIGIHQHPKLLPYATPEEVGRVTREIISIMKPGGGFIIGPTHSIPGDVPPENIIAMLEAFKNQQ